jgi:hypothetical protein
VRRRRLGHLAPAWLDGFLNVAGIPATFIF